MPWGVRWKHLAALSVVNSRIALFFLQNNPEIKSLEAKLIDMLKGDGRNDGKLLITLENIGESQPDCWKRREYTYTW